MDGSSDQLRRLRYGEIVWGEENEVFLRHPAAVRPLRVISRDCSWRPPETARDQAPPGFVLPLQCVIAPDGLRRIWPGSSWEGFLEFASAGGLAILCQCQNLSAEQRFSYRAMRFLFRRARRMAEFFAQSFRHSRDLFIIRSARTDPDEKDVLPIDIGLDDRDQGVRWSVGEVRRRGLEAACAAGWTNPTRDQQIQFGLLEAARLRPLVIPAAKTPLLIRSALFEMSPTFDELDPDLIDMVTERTLEALKHHVDDDSPRFDRWFGGPKSSFVHQIAKKKRSRGGQLEEDQVREALLSLGWQAYHHMANCLQAQMRCVQNALPMTLTEHERLIFDHMYLRQSYLGNFPLVLLIERFGFLKGILVELWEQLPDTSLIPVFHRLLDYYSVMAVRRREVDRQRKSGRPRTLVETACGRSTHQDQFQEIAAAVRELRHIACPLGHTEWRAEPKGDSKNMVTITHYCLKCTHQAETTLSRDAFVRLGP